MGRRRTQTVLGVAALALAGSVAAGCGSSAKTASVTTTVAASATTVASGSAPAATTSMLNIQSFAFHPASLTVAPGATVTVHNSDASTHTVTASGSSKGAFDTGDIAPNKTTTFKAPTKAGSYSYICNIHQFMMGTLVVS